MSGHAWGLAGSIVAAALLYLATPHQRLGRRWRPHATALRWAALAVFCLSVASAAFVGAGYVAGYVAGQGAAQGAGLWPALFTNLCMLMLACVAIPVANAWRAKRHVG